ncbi:MAG: hypothetical protein LBK73_14075 [Treponema sp.]|jgi:hypothetical protein|nr:hypothetical protein [Treponema sp.]
MSKSTNWLSNSRYGILAMAGDWISVCTIKQAGWNIPGAALIELDAIRDAVASALETTKNETIRTPVDTAQCKKAFDALTGFMRDFKRRYFLSPPLTDSDYISLGLKPHDSPPTPSTTPTAQMGGVLRSETPNLSGVSRIVRRELGVRIACVTGSPGDPDNKGCRIWYSVAAPGETPPTNPRKTPQILLHPTVSDIKFRQERRLGADGDGAHSLRN